jgi:hypothetical protein
MRFDAARQLSEVSPRRPQASRLRAVHSAPRESRRALPSFWRAPESALSCFLAWTTGQNQGHAWEC